MAEILKRHVFTGLEIKCLRNRGCNNSPLRLINVANCLIIESFETYSPPSKASPFRPF